VPLHPFIDTDNALSLKVAISGCFTSQLRLLPRFGHSSFETNRQDACAVARQHGEPAANATLPYGQVLQLPDHRLGQCPVEAVVRLIEQSSGNRGFAIRQRRRTQDPETGRLAPRSASGRIADSVKPARHAMAKAAIAAPNRDPVRTSPSPRPAPRRCDAWVRIPDAYAPWKCRQANGARRRRGNRGRRA
jgi:hypothetical protein